MGAFYMWVIVKWSLKVFFSEQTGEAIIVKLDPVSVNSQWVGN